MSNQEHMKIVSDENFQKDVMDHQGGVVLVDFWAQWCGPCRALAPKLEEVCEELSGQMTLAKMDIEKNQKTPATYGVRSIPTLILFKDGKQVDQMIGNHPKEHIRAFVEKHL